MSIHPRLDQPYPPVSSLAAAAMGVVAAFLTLAGWAWDLPRLTDWWGLGISMLPNAGVGILLASLGLAATALERRVLAAALAAAAAALGTAVLMEHGFGLDLGIDRVLLARTWGQNAAASPGRIGVPASISLLMLGTSLLILLRGNPRSKRLAAGLAALVMAVTLLSLVGYLFRADHLYALPRLTTIASQTAMSLFVLAFGVLRLPALASVARWRAGSAAADLWRRSLPAIVAIPLALGWLSVRATQAESFDIGFGMAVVVLAVVILFAILLWLALGSLDAYERRLQANADRLRASEERMQLAMSIANAATWDADLVAGQVHWSASHFTLLGYVPTADGLATEGMWISALHPDEAEAVQAAWQTAQSNLSTFNLEHRFINQATRAELWVKAAGRIFRDDDGKPVRCVGVFFDTTEQKVAELASERLATELQESNRNKDVFLATLAHELRNPLAPMVSGLDVLDRANGDRYIVEQVATSLRRQVKQVTRLVEDLLDASRITRNKLELRLQPMELATLLQQAVEMVQPLAAKHRLNLDLQLPDAPLLVQGDSARLLQVFGNLLTNACKFSRPGGQVSLCGVLGDGTVEVTVRDHGAGIAPEALPRIFDMFYQAEHAVERTKGGMGIGLTLAQQLVELHGGQILATSAGLDRGAEFTVRLPMLAGTDAGPVSPAGAADLSRLRGRRALLVDDNPDIVESMFALLDLLGTTSQVAYEGLGAVQLAASQHFELILLDIGMPGISGYETCRRIRAGGASQNATIIAVSGWGKPSDAEEARAAGFDGHLVKPVDIESIAALLDRLEPKLPGDRHVDPFQSKA